MATTRGWALRGNIVRAIEYILDSKNGCEKTEEGTLVYCSNSVYNSQTIGYEWQFDKKINSSKKISEVGYHLQFSFPNGVGTPEDCLQMAKEWVDTISNGKAQYVVAVHTNTKSIHAHIICNNRFVDGSSWDIFWKRDKKVFRAAADRICKAHGYEILEATAEKGMHYFEWMDKNDSKRDSLKKLIDMVISKVASYEDFKNYFNAIGVETIDNQSILENEKNVFVFTVNNKLIQQDDDGSYVIRIPYQQTDFIRVDADCFEWIKKGVNAKIQIPIDKEVAVLDKNNVFMKSVFGNELKSNFENKNRKSIGLKMRLPNTNHMIRTKSIRDEKGNIYTLENIKKKIRENSVMLTDTDIYTVIQNKNDAQKMFEAYRDLCERAGVKTMHSSSTVFKSFKQANYYAWKSSAMQKRMDELSYRKLLEKDRMNLPLMRERMEELKKELVVVYKAIDDIDMEIQKLMEQRIENIVKISDNEIEKAIVEIKEPLLVRKNELKQMIALYEKRIAKSENQTKQNKKQILERM